MTSNFRLFGPVHLLILGAVVLLAAGLAVIQRKLLPGTKVLRLGLAVTLLSDSVVFYGYQITHGQLTFPDHLPLELCDASLCLVVIALS